MRILFAFVLFSFFACDSKPKVIVEDVATQQAAGTMPSNNPATTVPGQESGQGADVHQVKAVEILQAEKYTYMKVVENADTFWIAASKMDAAKGRSYFYRGGLLKTNFESQEFNRTFDKIFLVSQIIDASAHPGGKAPGDDAPMVADVDIKKIEGLMSLSTLLAQPSKYAGKAIVVGGKVVKVNNGIMGKNWVHIQDGTSIKGKKCDLAITTQENILMGTTVAFEGKIFVDKDFGAGYRYDIIMEEAVVKK
ncbi:MAG: hypothetical protein KA340_15220 [Saprospiraceae bacterium]|nr:hypothetical protein [Saprospiraceae bacterium]